MLRAVPFTAPLPAPTDQPQGAAFTLQHVIMEYVTERLVEGTCRAIECGEVEFLDRYALLKAQSKDYVRQSQGRIILQPLAERLLARLGVARLEAQLQRLLAILRARTPQVLGYAGGNILHLLLHLGCELRGYDFSGLSVWQADLRGVTSAAVNFSGADLSRSAFTSVFGLNVLHFTAAGQLLVAGLVSDELCLWRAADAGLQELFRRPGAGPRAIVFSQDARRLATCGLDHSVHVWSTASGERLHTLQGHTGQVLTLAFSSDGQRLASSSRDRTVRVWDLTSGLLLHTLHEHAAGISGLAFSTDGAVLAGGGDQVICLWDTRSGRVIRILLGHRREIECFTFTADDRQLVSGAHDGSIEPRVLTAQGCTLSGVTFSPDGQLAVATAYNGTVHAWDVGSGQRHELWSGSEVTAVQVAFSPDGATFACVRSDQLVEIRHAVSGALLQTLRGRRGAFLSIAFNPTQPLLASSGWDGMIRIWDMEAGACVHMFRAPGPYDGMCIAGVTGISDAQRAALQALGAAD